VFEAAAATGGLLRYGIPEYRLPNAIVEQEIRDIEEVGVEIKTNSPVKDVKALLDQGYDAVFLATGASSSRKMGIPGEDAEGVLHALSFLTQANGGESVQIGEKVAVVGGGNAAIDAARVALRLGAKDVSIIYRRSRIEMPALEDEVDDAEAEGIRIEILAAPTKVFAENGRLKSVECQRMELGAPDASGRRRPVPMEGSEFNLPLDNLIIAIGQEVDRDGVHSEMELTGWGTPSVDPDTLQASFEGVFAGGDLVSGPADVISAIADGRTAASAIDRYLGGDGDIDESLAPPEGEVAELNPDEMEGEKHRLPMAMLPAAKRCNCFDLIELGYKDGEAVEESNRCLRCDLEEE
jgi:heterodisulfide reductase subunit A